MPNYFASGVLFSALTKKFSADCWMLNFFQNAAIVIMADEFSTLAGGNMEAKVVGGGAKLEDVCGIYGLWELRVRETKGRMVHLQQTLFERIQTVL